MNIIEKIDGQINPIHLQNIYTKLNNTLKANICRKGGIKGA